MSPFMCPFNIPLVVRLITILEYFSKVIECVQVNQATFCNAAIRSPFVESRQV